jgi:hypothetical protein
VNVSIALAALVFSFKVVPADAPAEAEPVTFDVLGTLLLSPGFAVLVYGRMRNESQQFHTSTRLMAGQNPPDTRVKAHVETAASHAGQPAIGGFSRAKPS